MHNLTAVVLNEIMKADGSNEDLFHKLRPIKDSLDNKLLKIRYMDYVTAKMHMQKL